MYIYKITNNINNKIYIGKTIKSIEERFKRHINDAESNRLSTHLASAIRKYGAENFYIEKIDEALTEDELNKKEIYWINFYKSYENGYNETLGGEGGNTYKLKTEEEMNMIKKKISKSKMGGKNHNARKIKIKNIKTNEEIMFDSAADVKRFFNHKNHNFVIRRCKGEIKCLWQEEWLMAYAENDYPNDYTIGKGNARAKKIQLTDLDTNQQYIFMSYAEAERFYNLEKGYLSKTAYRYNQAQPFILHGKFKIQILN